jgi:hypothetical protein
MRVVDEVSHWHRHYHSSMSRRLQLYWRNNHQEKTCRNGLVKPTPGHAKVMALHTEDCHIRARKRWAASAPMKVFKTGPQQHLGWQLNNKSSGFQDTI